MCRGRVHPHAWPFPWSALFWKSRHPCGRRQWTRVVQAAANDDDASKNDCRGRGEQFLWHYTKYVPLIRNWVVLQHVANNISDRLRAVTSSTNDEDSFFVDDSARFEVAATVRQVGDRAPCVRGRIKPVAGVHVNLRFIVTVIAAQGIDLSIEDDGGDVSSWIGQVGLALPDSFPTRIFARRI